MSRFWSPVVHSLTPYTPGEQVKLPNLVKLNTNENPYGPSPKAVAAMQQAVGDQLRLYPDPNGTALKDALARHHGLAREQIFVGNSSDEVLAHTFHALLKHDLPLLCPDISYSFYPTYCSLYGIAYRAVPLNARFEIDVDDYAQPCGAIILANPNAPTGRALSLAQIERLLAAHRDQVVVIDEAYVDFGAQSAITLIDRHPNLLVVHTTSKARSLAGMRVGFAFGHVDLIDALNRVKDSFNSYPLDRLAQVAAQAAYEDTDYFAATCRRVIDSRTRLTHALEALGFDVVPSAANFVFARHPAHDAGTLAATLKDREIFVRHFRAPRIDQHLRITVGTDAECDALVAALREMIG